MGLLSWIGGFILVIWLLGFVFSIGGAMIHLLLVVAAITFIFDFATGRRRVK
jgi:hypothetical protein